MAVTAHAWRFVQQGGERKELVLGGLDAPWGRPRQKPVVNDAVEVRETTVYYAGSDQPTRHIFGLRYEPWELTGRIGDRNPVSSNPTLMPSGTGYAKTLVDYIKRFVSDQQPVVVQWGNILSAQGFIRRFEPKREAEYEVEYSMLVLIDADESTPKAVTGITSRRSVQDAVAQAIAALNTIPQKLQSDDIKPSLLDSLDNLVSLLNSPSAALLSLSTQVSSVEKAVIGDLRRLRAGIGQVKTAAMGLFGTLESFGPDAAEVRRSASADMTWMGGRADSAAALIAALGQLETLNKQAEIAERGRPYTSYVAQYGDSWELISTKTLGGPDKADVIRVANGITGGTAPEPGRAYKIPFPS